MTHDFLSLFTVRKVHVQYFKGTRMKNAACILAAAALVLFAPGCGRSQNYAGEDYAYSSMDRAAALYGDAEFSPAPGAPGEGAADSGAPRKLIMRADLRMRVEDPAASGESLRALMEKYGAYPESSTARENVRNYTIRVPREKYGAMLAELEGLGRVFYKSENAEDVTVRFYDLQGRLETKRRILETYRGYLAKAANIEEILSVEARIADLENEIDGTGRELRALAGLIDYSTVELSLTGPAAAVPRSAPSLGEQAGKLFGLFGQFASALLLVIIGFVIFGIPVILLAVLLFWLSFGRVGLIKKLLRLAAGKK
ncbi:MAG: DUF4349 domain-containing protein [Treponema sp.]|jgi:hypothetical protein|nr:DUF4349 domain-containing protein [Treponema sp.]